VCVRPTRSSTVDLPYASSALQGHNYSYRSSKGIHGCIFWLYWIWEVYSGYSPSGSSPRLATTKLIIARTNLTLGS
jgi:hypothetical protein